jgi:hypothetical protein
MGMHIAVLLLRGFKTTMCETGNSGGAEMLGSCIKKMFYLGILVFMGVPAMAQGRAGFGDPSAGSRGGGECLLTSMQLQSLDNEEISGLIHMREEEKLARDIYQTMDALWPDRIFHRIALSEQRHMNAIEVLLDRYELEDPVADKGIGEFSSGEMQSLYQDLAAMGQWSHMDALKVGAMIEDLDLYDLEEALERTDNEDIKMVYENLMHGSENHMRAFVGRLRMLGEDYEPRYISSEELSGILASGNASDSGMAGRGRGSRQRGFGRGMCLRNGNNVTQ